MPIISVQFKDKIIDKYPMESGQTITIGRKESNDITIDNLAVSGIHARIDSVSATFILTDLQSTNGTFVNEQLVSTHNLRNQDIIIIGKHQLLFDSTDIDQKLDADFGEDNLDHLEDNDEFDKTRYLDTAEYRELIEKARDGLIKK
jgi:pSer/pThr/pTyr-binding forkhead associated (FHA) protein